MKKKPTNQMKKLYDITVEISALEEQHKIEVAYAVGLASELSDLSIKEITYLRKSYKCWLWKTGRKYFDMAEEARAVFQETMARHQASIKIGSGITTTLKKLKAEIKKMIGE